MPLPNDIEEAARLIGWDVLYAEHFKSGELRAPNASGEMSAKSPFPFSNDGHASFSASQYTGLFVDFHTAPITGMKGGNFVQFIAMMYFVNEYEGKLQFDWQAAERWVRVRLGLGKTVDVDWLNKVQATLKVEGSRAHETYRGRKPWSPYAMVALGMGYDERTGRLVFPFYDRKGSLQNCRMYSPGGEPKMFWLNSGMQGNFLFPHTAANEDWVVLVEGEPDVVTLRTLGFNGCSGTMGSGNPLPGPPWWAGKTVFVLMDDDKAGREAADSASSQLIKGGAANVRVIPSLPDWDGKPHNADISDYVVHLYRSGANTEQVQTAIRALLTEAPTAESPDAIWDAAPKDEMLHDVIRSHNAGQRIRTKVHTLATSPNMYRQAVTLRATCPGQGRKGCATCAMNLRWKGAATINIDPRSEFGLKTYNYTDEEVDRALRKEYKIDLHCPLLEKQVTKSVDVQQVVLGQTLQDSTQRIGSVSEGLRIESVFLLKRGTSVLPNQDYYVEGFVHPHPKSQRQILVVDKCYKINSSAEDFKMSEEIKKRLSIFQPGPMTTTAKLTDRANDIADSVSLIRGRQDLHLLYMCVWHGAIAFTFGNRHYERGWIEALVIGDTRCGKSAAFKSMALFFNTGLLVDCKMQSPAGILGAVEISSLTGERYVVPGVMPQQDGAGPIAFDEFTSKSWEKSPMIEVMSSTRAEGKVAINKAAKAEFPARVPSIWMCNPGMGMLMRDIGGFGVQMMSRLISQPEDIARFDVAMAVAQEEVSVDILNSVSDPKEPRYSRDDCRLLISWIRSRTADQIVFTEDAEHAVMAMAKAMFEKYDASIPLVEPADQRNRIAKIAVAVAGQLFSCDETGNNLVVQTEHVHAVWALYSLWYNKPAFGYDRYSELAKRDRCILNETEVREALDNRVKNNKQVVFAEKLLQLASFSERVLATLAPIDYVSIHGLLQILSSNRCIQPDPSQGRNMREMWIKTPQFTDFLRRYIEYRQRLERPLE